MFVCTGEEDMHAYDLSRLQKPVNPDFVVPAGKDPRREMAPPGLGKCWVVTVDNLCYVIHLKNWVQIDTIVIFLN